MGSTSLLKNPPTYRILTSNSPLAARLSQKASLNLWSIILFCIWSRPLLCLSARLNPLRAKTHSENSPAPRRSNCPRACSTSCTLTESAQTRMTPCSCVKTWPASSYLSPPSPPSHSVSHWSSQTSSSPATPESQTPHSPLYPYLNAPPSDHVMTCCCYSQTTAAPYYNLCFPIVLRNRCIMPFLWFDWRRAFSLREF